MNLQKQIRTWFRSKQALMIQMVDTEPAIQEAPSSLLNKASRRTWGLTFVLLISPILSFHVGPVDYLLSAILCN